MGSSRGHWATRGLAVAVVVLCVWAASSACGGEGGEGRGSPVQLVYWSWVPGLEKEIELFEEAHPDVDVKLVNVAQGGGLYTKLRTALKAGSGAPDLAQIEYQYLPSFRQIDALVDLSEYGANDIGDDFEPWTWDQVSDGESVYAIPWDSGPMGLLYRADIFDEYGLDVPETWEEFAAAAEKLHGANPDIFITNFPPNDGGWAVGLLWQAGARPFELNGTEITIDMDGPEATRVAGYWSDLIERGLVDTTSDFTNEWYSGLAEGKYATWITAAWGPLFLKGIAEKTAGKWRVAPMPQWSPGENASANWGGSTTAVIAQSEHPEEAAKFAMWINHDSESVRMFAEDAFLFPVVSEYLESPQFQSQKSPFYGGQEVNRVFVDASKSVDTGFEWSPFQDFVYAQWNNVIGDAVGSGQDLVDAFGQLEQTFRSHAEEQGFQVR